MNNHFLKWLRRLGFVLLVVACAMAALAKKKGPATQPSSPAVSPEVASLSLEDLNQRVSALEAIDAYQMTRAQGEAMLKIIEPRKSAPANPTTGPVSKELEAYRTELVKLYSTLVKGGVEDADLNDLKSDVDDLAEAAQYVYAPLPELSAPMREAGRKFAAELTAGQIASSLSLYASSVTDPVELAVEAAEARKSAKAQNQWPAIRDGAANELGYLLAGAGETASKAIAARVSAWLDANPEIDEATPGSGRPALEASARKMLGPIDSWIVLRRWVERDVARTLSNPQLGAMLRARMAAAQEK